MTEAETKVIATITKHGGLARTRDIIASGVHSDTLYSMRDAGKIQCVSRGLFQLADTQLADPDLETVFCEGLQSGKAIHS